MRHHIPTLALICAVLFVPKAGSAQQMEFIGKPPRDIPLSQAVKVGKFVFVSGTPAYKDGKVAVGDFPAQARQSMENLTGVLKAAGTDWQHVVKTTVLLTRREDFNELNRVYATYFPDGKYPARTTEIVGLNNPDFMLEIECEAVLE